MSADPPKTRLNFVLKKMGELRVRDRKLCRHIGTPRKQWEKIKRGEATLTLETTLSILHVMGVSTDEFLNYIR